MPKGLKAGERFAVSLEVSGGALVVKPTPRHDLNNLGPGELWFF